MLPLNFLCNSLLNNFDFAIMVDDYENTIGFSNNSKSILEEFSTMKSSLSCLFHCIILHHQLIIIFSAIFFVYHKKYIWKTSNQKNVFFFSYFSFIAASNPRYHLGKSINFLWYKILLYFVAMASHTRNMKMLSSPPAYIYFVHVAAFWLLIKSFSIQYGCSILTYGILFAFYHSVTSFVWGIINHLFLKMALCQQPN